VLTGIAVDVQAAIDCYGAFVVGTPPEGFPLQVQPLADRIPELDAPLLGLFGNEDSYPSPDQVDELEKLLQENGKPYEFHRYDDAGHAFFSVDRPAYRVAAAVDGWERIRDFLARHLEG
jgi:carboxymethylenebutenolidase